MYITKKKKFAFKTGKLLKKKKKKIQEKLALFNW